MNLTCRCWLDLQRISPLIFFYFHIQINFIENANCLKRITYTQHEHEFKVKDWFVENHNEELLRLFALMFTCLVTFFLFADDKSATRSSHACHLRWISLLETLIPKSILGLQREFQRVIWLILSDINEKVICY